MNGLFEASQPIDTSNEDVLDPAGLEISNDTQPEVGRWPSRRSTVTEPMAKHVAIQSNVTAIGLPPFPQWLYSLDSALEMSNLEFRVNMVCPGCRANCALTVDDGG